MNCIDCNKSLNRGAKYDGSTRCKDCWYKFMKSKNNPNYKDGKQSKNNIFKCLDCKKILCDGRVKKCLSCTKKEYHRNNPDIMKGVNSPAYIDGRSNLTNLIRNCYEYIKWRKSIFIRDNYTCCKCGQHGGNLNADHIKPFSIIISKFLKKYNQFSPIEDKETLVRLAITYKPFWNINNGQTLCEDCHKKTDTYGKKVLNLYKEIK